MRIKIQFLNLANSLEYNSFFGKFMCLAIYVREALESGNNTKEKNVDKWLSLEACRYFYENPHQ